MSFFVAKNPSLHKKDYHACFQKESRNYWAEKTPALELAKCDVVTKLRKMNENKFNEMKQLWKAIDYLNEQVRIPQESTCWMVTFVVEVSAMV